MGFISTLKPDSVPKVMALGIIGALCTFIATVAWMPADHVFKYPHIDKEKYEVRQLKQEAAIIAIDQAQQRMDERFAVTTEQVFKDIEEIKDGVNNINDYLRAPRYTQPVPKDLNSD